MLWEIRTDHFETVLRVHVAAPEQQLWESVVAALFRGSHSQVDSEDHLLLPGPAPEQLLCVGISVLARRP